MKAAALIEASKTVHSRSMKKARVGFDIEKAAFKTPTRVEFNEVQVQNRVASEALESSGKETGR